jgi:hypothetical protein
MTLDLPEGITREEYDQVQEVIIRILIARAIKQVMEKSEPLTEDKREGGEDRQGLGEGR